MAPAPARGGAPPQIPSLAALVRQALWIVVRADNEAQARALAQSGAGTEGLGIYRGLGCSDEAIAAGVWLDSAYTGCDELDAVGPVGIVLADRRAA